MTAKRLLSVILGVSGGSTRSDGAFSRIYQPPASRLCQRAVRRNLQAAWRAG